MGVIKEYCQLIYLDFLNDDGSYKCGFTFTVKKQNAVDVMQHLLVKLSEYHLTNVSAVMGEDVIASTNEIWTPQAIDICLDVNLTHGNILTRKQEQ